MTNLASRSADKDPAARAITIWAYAWTARLGGKPHERRKQQPLLACMLESSSKLSINPRRVAGLGVAAAARRQGLYLPAPPTRWWSAAARWCCSTPPQASRCDAHPQKLSDAAAESAHDDQSTRPQHRAAGRSLVTATPLRPSLLSAPHTWPWPSSGCGRSAAKASRRVHAQQTQASLQWQARCAGGRVQLPGPWGSNMPGSHTPNAARLA